MLSEIVAGLRIELYSGLGNRDTIRSHVIDFLKFNALNKSLFSGDDIFFSSSNPGRTLLDCRIDADADVFGQKLVSALLGYLDTKRSESLVLYPLLGFNAATSSPEFTGFRLVRNDDQQFWSNMTQIHGALAHFDPSTGMVSGKRPLFVNHQTTNLWLTYRTVTDFGLDQQIISRKFRLILALLLAQASEQNRTVHMKTMGYPYNGLFVFHHGRTVSQVLVSDYLHSFSGTIELSPYNVEVLSEKLSRILGKPREQANRVELFTNFFMKAMNETDEDRAISLFIAFDAMWGIDGQSRRSVSEGIAKHLPNVKEADKCASLLYDLRCCLLHGGCSSIDDWADFDKFVQMFGCKPQKTIMEIGLQVLKNM